MILSCIVLVFTVGLCGCKKGNSVSDYKEMFKDPSAETMKAVVRTTVPLAYAASVAMATACTASTTSSYPCTATVDIPDDNTNLPLQFADFGTIRVYGYWFSADDALFTVLFVNTYAGSRLFQVNHVSTFLVTKTLDGKLRIVYANIDIDIARGPVKPNDLSKEERDLKLGMLDITSSSEASANVDMEAWIVDVNDMNTPNVFSDDKYTISGGGQYIEISSGAASILQLGMANVEMGSGCAQNPVSGWAALNELSDSDSQTVVATAAFSFGAACDGNVKILGATGNYLLSNGTSIPLNLSNP